MAIIPKLKAVGTGDDEITTTFFPQSVGINSGTITITAFNGGSAQTSSSHDLDDTDPFDLSIAVDEDTTKITVSYSKSGVTKEIPASRLR